jgi:hypothetical protein
MIAKAPSRILEATLEVETLKTIVLFCAIGLTVSLVYLLYGVDLAPGF